MKIFEVKDRITTLINNLLEVWEDSVKDTYLFLSNISYEKQWDSNFKRKNHRNCMEKTSMIAFTLSIISGYLMNIWRNK